MTELNELALRAHYDRHRDAYLKARKSGDPSKWDEAYKWGVLPTLNDALQKYNSITAANFKEVLDVLTRANPNQGSFAHWIDVDDLKPLATKPNGWQVLNAVWAVKPENAAESIDNANTSSNFLIEKRFSPSTYGYILAAQNCDKFCVSRDKLLKLTADIQGIEKTGSWSTGKKYQFVNESAQVIAKCMEEDKQELDDYAWFNAINGQDFLYVTLVYPEEQRR